MEYQKGGKNKCVTVPYLQMQISYKMALLSVELDLLFPELEINPGLKTAPWREAPEKLPTAGSPSVWEPLLRKPGHK